MTGSLELVYQAHQKLHDGDINACHELLHQACGIVNDMPAGQVAPLSHWHKFEQAFATACRKNGVQAAFVIMQPHADDPDRVRIVAGGNAMIAAELAKAMK